MNQNDVFVRGFPRDCVVRSEGGVVETVMVEYVHRQEDRTIDYW